MSQEGSEEWPRGKARLRALVESGQLRLRGKGRGSWYEAA